MPTTLLIVKNQGQPSNWSHYRNNSTNALHFSAFRISIEAGDFQIEKINAGKLDKVLWSNVTVMDDSSGTPVTYTPTSPIDLANILEGLGYPAYNTGGYENRFLVVRSINDGDMTFAAGDEKRKFLVTKGSGDADADLTFTIPSGVFKKGDELMVWTIGEGVSSLSYGGGSVSITKFTTQYFNDFTMARILCFDTDVFCITFESGNALSVDTANDFANDAAAAAGGIQIGQGYHNSGAARIRLT